MTAQKNPSDTTAYADIVERMQDMLAEDLAATEKLLVQRAKSPVDVIPDLSGYIVSAGGKRLRPMITLIAAQACGGTNPGTHALATAVEFIHTATLLHDDVVDDSDLRRGKKAAKNVWGNNASILVGDFLFARAFTLMVETGNLEILRILSDASSVIAEGEVHQLAAAARTDLPTEEYLAIIEAKTAALFQAAAEAGALSAGPDGETYAADLAAYGKYLGLAFQIVDDALDYGGTTSVIGKAVGDDFREGKTTLPVIIARRRGAADDQAFWDRAMNVSTQAEGDLAHAIYLIRSTGAAEATVAEAHAYADLAKASLRALPESAWTRALADLADFCVSRVH
ncbi:MAG: polyprenyl synthetase family protein [Pseudomonadota bacterium]